MLPMATPAVSSGVSGFEGGAAAASVSVALLVGALVKVRVLRVVSYVFVDIELVRELRTELSVPVFVFVMKPLSDVGVERIADVVVDKKGLNVNMSRRVPGLVSWELMTILAVNNGALGVGVSPVALEVELFVHPVDAV